MFEGDGAQWEMFVQQARELLLSSRADLQLLEKQGDAVGPQVLERLIRIFHSIGSLSNFFKLNQISTLLERMEAILALWKEQPSLIETSSTAALSAAFGLLHQSFTMSVLRSDHPVLQDQIEILQDVFDNLAWKGAHKYLGTTPPFDLHDYPDDVAVAVAEGRHMFALHFPLPRVEQQHQLSQLVERLITVGELVTSVPAIGSDFELEKTSKALSVWLLFSTHLRQDKLMEMTQLSTEDLTPLPLPEMMRVAQAKAEAVEQPREKKFTELVLRTLQSHLDKTPQKVVPQAITPMPMLGATFKERQEEMELLALQMGPSHFRETAFARLRNPVLGAVFCIVTIVVLLWSWNHSDIVSNSLGTKRIVAPNVPHESSVIQNAALTPKTPDADKGITPTSVSVVPDVTASVTSKEEKSSDHTPAHQEEKSSTISKETTIAKEEKPLVPVEHQATVNTSPLTREESGRYSPISREAGTPFTAVIPPPNVAQGSLRLVRNCDDSITFSIATLLNHTVSRTGGHLLISQEMFQNIKLLLQNTNDDKGKALMFDFDAAGQLTISPSIWKHFIKKGSGVITVSHLFENRDGTSIIRDITALPANNINKRIIDQRKDSVKSCQGSPR